MADLGFICKRKFLTKLFEEFNQSWKILIVDKIALKIISSFCGMDDLLNNDILDVNNLEKKREPFMCPALYLISPTKSSIDKILEEFKDPNNPQYSCAYVACINSIEKEVFDKLKNTKRIKDVFVVPIDFHVIEQKVFSFQDPNGFFKLYSKNTTEEMKNNEIEKIGNSLASLLCCLNINPVIRYIETVEGSVSQQIANKVYEGFGKLSGCPVIDLDNLAAKTTRHMNLIICDRISDLVTPLMTEYSYESLLNDVLQNKKNVFEIFKKEKNEKKQIVLDENDAIWKIAKHKHIDDACTFVVQEYNSYKAKHVGLAGGAKQAKDMKEMQQMMKDLPEYMEMMGGFVNHFDLIQYCQHRREDLKLIEFSIGEQAVGTGLDEDGKDIKRPLAYVQSQIGNIILKSDRRLRELLIFLLSQDYSEEEKSSLMKMFQGKEEAQEVFAAINDLPKTKREKMSKKLREEMKVHDQYSRFIPFIKELVVRMANNDVPEYCKLYKLLFNGFPVEIEHKQGNITVAAGKTLKKQKTKQNKEEGKIEQAKKEVLSEKELLGSDSNVLVIFVTGAISYSEMRVAYELSEKLKINVFIGSHYICNQTRFIKMLKSLGNPEYKDITEDLVSHFILEDEHAEVKK